MSRVQEARREVSSAGTAGGRRVVFVLVWEVGAGPRRGQAVFGLLVGPPRGHVMWDQCGAGRARTRNASGGSSPGQGEFSGGQVKGGSGLARGSTAQSVGGAQRSETMPFRSFTNVPQSFGNPVYFRKD